MSTAVPALVQLALVALLFSGTLVCTKGPCSVVVEKQMQVPGPPCTDHMSLDDRCDTGLEGDWRGGLADWRVMTISACG